MKLLGSVLIVLAVLLTQVGIVAAAPQAQEGTVTINGTVTEIGQPVTDENGVTTVLITVDTAEGLVTIRVSDTVAAGLTVGAEVQDLVVNSGDVVPPEEEPTEDVHPISALLADFFEVDASVIDSFHNGEFEVGEGEEAEAHVFGFGVIAQALWMATETEGDVSTTDIELASAILQAKQSGNYEDVAALLGWEEGDEIPTNWGQFKKALKDKHENLGAVISNHADQDADDQPGQGNDKENKGKGQKKEKKNKP